MCITARFPTARSDTILGMVRALGATLACTAALLLVPVAANAFPFGGQASTVLRCVYNSTIYTRLGPPRGGEFIWTTGTKTYQFGPPAYAGQWILGLASPPYYCIYKISPLIIYTGVAITMMGSSGVAAPPAPPMTSNEQLRTGALPSGGSASGGASASAAAQRIGHVVISEVHYAPDSAHGSKPQNEWIEIYNGASSAMNLTGWTLRDASGSSDALPANIILGPGSFVVVGATSSTRALWSVPEAQYFSLGSPIGDGLSGTAEYLSLRNAAGAIVDALSWGANTAAFSPSVLPATYGNSTARSALTKDTDTAADWATLAPTPGK